MSRKEELTKLLESEGLDVSVCECGAVSISTPEGTYSVQRKNFKEHFPRLDGVTRFPSLITNRYSGCNWCVNSWGLDICECGSGEPYKKCCGKPMQKVGEYTRVKGRGALMSTTHDL